MSSSKNKVTTEVDDWGRKKFTLLQEDEQEDPPQPENTTVEVGRHKSLLVARQEGLNIEKYTGRIEKNKKKKNREVFFCEVCKQGFKCDMAYITHLNSPHHNSKLGMSMKVRAVTPQEVKAKLQALKTGEVTIAKNKLLEGQKKANEQQQVEQERARQEQVEPENQSEPEEQQQDLEEILKACGLPSSFGSKKVKR